MSTNTVLSEQKSLEVLEDLQEELHEIASNYWITVETIKRIEKNAEQMNTSEDECLDQTKRHKKLTTDESVSRKLLKWYKERRMAGNQVTDIAMLEKAIEIKIYHTFAGYDDCKLTFSWIAEFEKKNIVQLCEVEETMLCEKMIKLMTLRGVHIENVYNMSETRLLWQALPINTSTGEEQKIGDYELQKNRITIALCVNVSGKNKVPPFFVHDNKQKQQSSFLQYRFHKDAKMDPKILIDWFENHFKPSVQKYQEEIQIRGKVILFLDDRKTHKVLLEYQKSENYKFIYISTRTASLIQPMDLEIIKMTKTFFRYELLKYVKEYGIEHFNDYCLEDCADMLIKSWGNIPVNIIQNAWLKILPGLRTFYIINKPPPVEAKYSDLKDLVSEIIKAECTEDHIRNYISKCEEAENENE